MKKRFTCACNQFMNLANGTTTLLNHRLYCLLLWDKWFNTPTSLPLTPLPPPPHRLYHSANNTVISSSVQSFSLKIRRYHHRIPEYYWKSWSDQPFMVYKTKDQGVQMQRSIRCFPGILHLRAQYYRASKKFLSSDIMHLTAQCCMCKWQDLISATTKVMQQIYKGIPN